MGHALTFFGFVAWIEFLMYYLFSHNLVLSRRTEIGLPISNILFKSWHLIVISFSILSSSLDKNLLPKAFLNLKKAFSTNSRSLYLFLFLLHDLLWFVDTQHFTDLQFVPSWQQDDLGLCYMNIQLMKPWFCLNFNPNKYLICKHINTPVRDKDCINI